jgi:hypothetical protein
MTSKAVQKQVWGVPSLETAARIDDSDKSSALQAANFRFTARMRELETQFEAKAAELRGVFLAEVQEITGEREAA